MEKMTVIGSEDSWKVTTAIQFVKKFGLEKEFKEEYGEDIEGYELEEVPDEDIIATLLDKLEDKYFFRYIPENTGYFEIYKLDI